MPSVLKTVTFLVVTLCLLSSCASVPLGTLLKFSTFDEEDFAEINPENLSVRIFMQEPAQLGDGPVSLSQQVICLS